jgi:hypothetical protein
VDCIRTIIRDEEKGTEQVQFVIQLPLKPHAIQIQMTGPVDKEAEILKARTELLASLSGPTNWGNPETLHSGPTTQKKVEATAKVIFYGALAVLAFWYAFHTVARKKS